MRGNFDLLGYLASRGIRYSLEGKNVSQGWLGVKCPFCVDKSNHLGINLHSKAFSCFKCGETGTIFRYVAALEPGGELAARQVLAEFRSSELALDFKPQTEPVKHFNPPETTPLSGAAKVYLRKRKFPYKMLQTKYQIAGFDAISTYKFRLFIPVFFNEQMVTFTTRSYTDQIEPKYLHYPKRKSSLFVKETLYNIDNAKDNTVVVVEGPIDAWRIGDGAVATYGVVFTQKQIKLLRERFKRVFVMYDTDAQDQAEKLTDSLACFSLEVHNIKLAKGDPGGLTHTEAQEIRREIFGR